MRCGSELVGCWLAGWGGLEDRAAWGDNNNNNGSIQSFGCWGATACVFSSGPCLSCAALVLCCCSCVVVSKRVVCRVWHDWHFFENVFANIISHFPFFFTYLLPPPPPLPSFPPPSLLLLLLLLLLGTPLGEHNGNLMKTHWEHIGNFLGIKEKSPPPTPNQENFFFTISLQWK